MAHQKADYPLDYSVTVTKTTGDRLQNAADAAAAIAQELAGRVGDHAREYADQAQDAAKNFKPFVEKSLKEQPMATLVVAAIIGAALGALWKK